MSKKHAIEAIKRSMNDILGEELVDTSIRATFVDHVIYN